METVVIQIITPIVIAVVGGIWTLSSYLIQQSYNRSQIYFTFRSQFKQFQDKLPVNINSRDSENKYNYKPEDGYREEYERLIESYWWLVFDEWFICCKQCRSCKSLWKKYYSEGVLNALDRQEWKDAFFRLALAYNSFLGQDAEFVQEVERIYFKKYRQSLLKQMP